MGMMGTYIVCFAIGFALIPIIYTLQVRKLDTGYNKKKYHKVRKRHLRYLNSNITRTKYKRIYEMYTIIQCMKEEEVISRCVKTFEKTVLQSLIFPLFLMLTMQDVAITFLGFVMALVFYEIKIEASLDSIDEAITVETIELIKDVTLKYRQYRNILHTLTNTNSCTYLSKYVSDIIDIVSKSNSAELLDTFMIKCPYNSLKVLAQICYRINDSGDSVTDSGESYFLVLMSVLRNSVTLEYKGMIKRKNKFKGKTLMCLIGIAIMPIINAFLLRQLPGTAILIKGVTGYIFSLIVIFLTLICYYIVAKLKRKSVVGTNDRSLFIDGLLENEQYRTVVENIMPKTQKRYDKETKILDSSLSSRTLKYQYAAKLFYTSIAYFVGLVCIIIFVFTSKEFIAKNTRSLTAAPSTIAAEFKSDLIRLDKDLLKLERVPTKEEAETMVSRYVRGISVGERTEQVERIITKYNLYYSIDLKWWFPIIALLFGAIGWFIPEIQVWVRKMLVKNESADDASNLQTLMMCLSATSIDTYNSLFVLISLASAHKQILRHAFISYTKDPILTLETIRQKSDVQEFKSMSNKLIESVYNLELKDAFKDAISDKDQMLFEKQEEMFARIESQGNLAAIICMIPPAVSLLLNAVATMLMLAMQQLEAIVNFVQ